VVDVEVHDTKSAGAAVALDVSGTHAAAAVKVTASAVIRVVFFIHISSLAVGSCGFCQMPCTAVG
jgi:hypothetical protein